METIMTILHSDAVIYSLIGAVIALMGGFVVEMINHARTHKKYVSLQKEATAEWVKLMLHNDNIKDLYKDCVQVNETLRTTEKRLNGTIRSLHEEIAKIKDERRILALGQAMRLPAGLDHLTYAKSYYRFLIGKS